MMDPNETLSEMLKIADSWQEWGALEFDPETTLDALSDLVLALDNWLSQGGFLPDNWR